MINPKKLIEKARKNLKDKGDDEMDDSKSWKKKIQTEKGWAKLETALCRGKKNYDKREVMKERDTKRDLDRVKKNFK